LKKNEEIEIKINWLLRFFCCCYRSPPAQEEEEKKPTLGALLPGLFHSGAWVHAPPVTVARGKTRRHCSCGGRRVSLQFLDF
jgi:hypothetical protein